jgi:hypothetical protein
MAYINGEAMVARERTGFEGQEYAKSIGGQLQKIGTPPTMETALEGPTISSLFILGEEVLVQTQAPCFINGNWIFADYRGFVTSVSESLVIIKEIDPKNRKTTPIPQINK